VQLCVCCVAFFRIGTGEIVVVEWIGGVCLNGGIQEHTSFLDVAGNSVGHRGLIDGDTTPFVSWFIRRREAECLFVDWSSSLHHLVIVKYGRVVKDLAEPRLSMRIETERCECFLNLRSIDRNRVQTRKFYSGTKIAIGNESPDNGPLASWRLRRILRDGDGQILPREESARWEFELTRFRLHMAHDGVPAFLACERSFFRKEEGK
jgi:hypothetical protein